MFLVPKKAPACKKDDRRYHTPSQSYTIPPPWRGIIFFRPDFFFFMCFWTMLQIHFLCCWAMFFFLIGLSLRPPATEGKSRPSSQHTHPRHLLYEYLFVQYAAIPTKMSVWLFSSLRGGPGPSIISIPTVSPPRISCEFLGHIMTGAKHARKNIACTCRLLQHGRIRSAFLKMAPVNPKRSARL